MKFKNPLIFTLLLSFSVNAFALDAPADALPSGIRIAPPAPKFTDAERQAELARRRSAVAAQMSDKSMMILFSADARIYAGDVDYVYRQENNLYYLTNLKQNNATLVLAKDGGRVKEFLFVPRRDPQTETWNGRMYSIDEAKRISGLKTIIENLPVLKETEPTSELDLFLQSIRDKRSFAAQNGSFSSSFIPETVYLLQADPLEGNPNEYRKENEFKVGLNGYKVENASIIFAGLRLIKSPMEISFLQHAIDITTEAQMRAMSMVGRAKMEYEVQAEVEYTFRRRNADFWGYPSVVACGPNATTLHYEEAQGEVRPGDVMLMDVGAEYEHYSADVTRTFPVNGKFSKDQAEIYQIVYDAQEAVAKKAKPGVPFEKISDEASRIIQKGLVKLGLITAPDATYQMIFQGRTIIFPQYQLWYMHDFGHWLGMNVHDVGEYGKMQPGMVFTNEPGIYIRADALDYLPDTPANKELLAKIRPAFEKYKNIGVRIEDDMLVTGSGVEWLTKDLPRSMADIEAFMSNAPKDLQSGAARRGWISTKTNTAFSNLNRTEDAFAE